MRLPILPILIALATLAAPGPRAAAPADNLFYQALPYGSQAAFNPFFVLVNGAYDMVQTQAASNRVATLDYAAGFRNVNRNLLHPLDNIARYGWSDFLGNEILPASPEKDNSQWIPNYTLHMVGGGLTWARALIRFAGAP